MITAGAKGISTASTRKAGVWYRQAPRYYYSEPVYAPPPVVYYPEPYQSPGISIVFPIRIR